MSRIGIWRPTYKALRALCRLEFECSCACVRVYYLKSWTAHVGSTHSFHSFMSVRQLPYRHSCDPHDPQVGYFSFFSQALVVGE